MMMPEKRARFCKIIKTAKFTGNTEFIDLKSFVIFVFFVVNNR